MKSDYLFFREGSEGGAGTANHERFSRKRVEAN